MPHPSDIDEEGLQALVGHFYARVRADGQLGPIFNRAITDWPEHEKKLTAFWSSVMRGTRRYGGQPLPAHMRHQAALSPALFQHWLRLWGESARASLSPAAADAIIAKAQRIGASLQIALFHLLPEGPAPSAPQPPGAAPIAGG